MRTVLIPPPRWQVHLMFELLNVLKFYLHGMHGIMFQSYFFTTQIMEPLMAGRLGNGGQVTPLSSRQIICCTMCLRSSIISAAQRLASYRCSSFIGRFQISHMLVTHPRYDHHGSGSLGHPVITNHSLLRPKDGSGLVENYLPCVAWSGCF